MSKTGNYTHWSARAARHKKYAGLDIYGNGEAGLREQAEMASEFEERLRQTMQAQRERRRTKAGEPWHRAMGIDEQFVPGTKIMFDYGKLYDPEPVKIKHELDS